VVGRLASELSIEVQLAQSPVTGVTARVSLPANLLAPPPPAISAPENGHRRPATTVTRVQAMEPPVETVDAQPIPMQREPRQVPVIEYRTTTGTAMPVPMPAPRPAHMPVPVPSMASFGVAVDERTVNGLRKRPPRGSKVDGERTEMLPVVNQTEKAEKLDASPQQVQSRLTALRAGFHRSEQERESRQ
jgi:hypothetical protein